MKQFLKASSEFDMKKLLVVLQDCWPLLKESELYYQSLKTKGKSLLPFQVKNWALLQLVAICSSVHSQNLGSCSSACS